MKSQKPQLKSTDSIKDFIGTPELFNSLWINSNQISPDNNTELAKTIEANKTLKFLSIHGNSNGIIDWGIIFESLYSNQTITDLDIGNIRIPSKDIKTLCNVLKSNINDLTLQFEKLNKEDIYDLADALKTSETIRDLSLYYSPKGKYIIELITGILSNKSLQNIFLSSPIEEAGINILTKFLSSTQTLHTLNLNIENISVSGAKELGKSLKLNYSLKNLTIKGHHLSDEVISAFSLGLKENKDLEHLSLLNCDLSDQGGKILISSLKSHPSLNYLEISRNKLSFESCAELGKLLTAENKITYLGLSDNQIDEQGAKAIAQSLGNNSSLEILNLSSNNIKNDGAINIFKQLEKNKVLNEVNLSENGITGDIVLPMMTSMQFNTSLYSINLNYNNIHNPELPTEEDRVKENIYIIDLRCNSAGPDQEIIDNLKLFDYIASKVKFIADTTNNDDQILGKFTKKELGNLLEYVQNSPTRFKKYFKEQSELDEKQYSLDKVKTFINENFFIVTEVGENIMELAQISGLIPEVLNLIASYITFEDMRLEGNYLLSNDFDLLDYNENSFPLLGHDHNAEG